MGLYKYAGYEFLTVCLSPTGLPNFRKTLVANVITVITTTNSYWLFYSVLMNFPQVCICQSLVAGSSRRSENESDEPVRSQ